MKEKKTELSKGAPVQRLINHNTFLSLNEFPVYDRL